MSLHLNMQMLFVGSANCSVFHDTLICCCVQVSVHYIGKLQKNGKIFDSNIRKAPFKFRLGTPSLKKICYLYNILIFTFSILSMFIMVQVLAKLLRDGMLV